MGECILITSGKGGVGKTTCCAVLGTILSRMGRKVLLVDGDMGLRDLDLMLGVQDEVLYTSRDLWEKNCFREEAIVSLSENLDFLPATQEFSWEDVKKKAFRKMVRRLQHAYDYVLIDGPAGIGKSLDAIVPVVDQIVLIVEPSWLSLRDVQKVQSLLQGMDYRNYTFMVNKMPVEKEMQVLSFEDIEQALMSDGLLTVLPWSVTAQRLSNDGNMDALLEDAFYKDMIEKALPVLEGGAYEDWAEIEEAYEAEAKRKSSSTNRRGAEEKTSGLSNMAKAVQRSVAWRWRRRGR